MNDFLTNTLFGIISGIIGGVVLHYITKRTKSSIEISQKKLEKSSSIEIKANNPVSNSSFEYSKLADEFKDFFYSGIESYIYLFKDNMIIMKTSPQLQKIGNIIISICVSIFTFVVILKVFTNFDKKGIITFLASIFLLIVIWIYRTINQFKIKFDFNTKKIIINEKHITSAIYI